MCGTNWYPKVFVLFTFQQLVLRLKRGKTVVFQKMVAIFSKKKNGSSPSAKLAHLVDEQPLIK